MVCAFKVDPFCICAESVYRNICFRRACYSHSRALWAFLHSCSVCSRLAGLSWWSLFSKWCRLFTDHWSLILCTITFSFFYPNTFSTRFGFCLSSLSICETGVGKSMPAKPDRLFLGSSQALSGFYLLALEIRRLEVTISGTGCLCLYVQDRFLVLQLYG